MSEDYKKRIQDSAIACVAFLRGCGVDPASIPVTKIYELAVIYHDYGPDGVRDYLGTDIGDGGIAELVS